MARILAQNVSLDIPVPTGRNWSLRSQAMQHLPVVGGHIRKKSGGIAVVRALENVSLDLQDGDRLAVIGHNGAGKTTLLRVLGGLLSPTAGKVRIAGSLMPMFDLASGFDEESTGYENIHLRGLVEGLTRKEIERRTPAIVEFSELGDYLDMPLRTYSSGMRLRLMFSIATAVAGDIILMDEWISVGDQAFQMKAQERLVEITRNAGILVIASHSRPTLRSTCNKALWLEVGQVKDFGDFDDVVAHEERASGSRE
ncbi:ABC transporter ATP-binding protein [Ahrensia sp. R2A130]|uniref:ABC transporter ATP-binding protein n=1 Tax=Ahrensia sp. R2A130 TaxID=744979 RepID=UPI0001E08C39|nr:ABC transporter ATP-binding protein [Ahrensia sp. R2A130]EFL89543.1 O-antigen export system ATP-binding protein RfbE [Ahrensia sp. R2A130]